MKCAELTSVGNLAIAMRGEPEAGPWDVLVDVDACCVCRTDRKAYAMGQRDLVLPRILGHEIAGRVKAVGSLVEGFKAGDRVQVPPGVGCGACAYCLSGADNLCQDVRIVGFHVDGGFSELLRVPGSAGRPAGLLPVPDALDARTAALTEPLACCLNMQRRMGMEDAETAVVFGGGPAGALSAKLARALGARRIAVVEPDERRRKLAALYSDCQFDFDSQTVGRILEMSGGKGADAVLPCCPGNAAMAMALEVAAKRGKVGFFSGLTETSIATAAVNLMHYKELRVVGSYGCSFSDNREALALLASGKVDVEGLPGVDISWEELKDNLSRLDASAHMFAFFRPNP